MTEIPDSPEPTARVSAADAQQALMALHALAGTYGDRDASAGSRIRTADTGTNLQTLASAPPDLVPASTRLGVLHRLARAGYPEMDRFAGDYQALAATVAEGRGDLPPADLLEDLRAAATGAGLSGSRTLRSSQHHEVAFLGDDDICTVRRVTVDGRDAVWIYSEFETDAPFDNVADWVDPNSWPKRSPLLFKGMSVVGAPQPVDIGGVRPARDLEHWHAVFLEEVQLVREVSTLLHCDYRRDGTSSAGMTYELTFSPDNEINVDRGYLLVNELGGTRHVKALKIVGFVDSGWNDVAERVCPIWTDFVRQAVVGGHTSGSRPPGGVPSGGAAPSFADSLDPWIQLLGESALTYLQLFDETSSRMSRRGYSTADWMEDGRRYWSQLAKDWARAWTTGLGVMEDLAERGLEGGVPSPTRQETAGTGMPGSAARAGSTPAGARAAAGTAPAAAAAGNAAGAGGRSGATPREEPDSTVVAAPGLGAGDAVTVSALVSIEAGGGTIPANEVTVTRVPLPDGTPGVRVHTRNRTAPAGLYLGELRTAAGQPLAAVQLYLSRATES